MLMLALMLAAAPQPQAYLGISAGPVLLRESGRPGTGNGPVVVAALVCAGAWPCDGSLAVPSCRSVRSIRVLFENRMVRSSTFSSSRMLPGQLWPSSAAIASSEMLATFFFSHSLNFFMMCRTSSGTSPARLRRGGMSSGTTLSR